MRALTLVALCTIACTRTTQVGSIACASAADCAAPSTICGPDARCIAGCVANSTSCIGGSTCDTSTGECSSTGLIGMSCSEDSACDPPDLVCSMSSHVCVAGCPDTGLCDSGETCNVATGHCCDIDSPGCGGASRLGTCDEDADCPSMEICSGNACIAGCATSGCTSPLACASSGHCSPATCTRDEDCDHLSYCTSVGACAALPRPGQSACAGGTTVDYDCAVEKTAASFESCTHDAGPASCPYCLDGSCFWPGLCATSADCHGGQTCESGLCRIGAPACPTVLTLDAIVDGNVGADRQVCVRGKVASAKSGYDGMIEIKLGDAPYLFVDVPPMYEEAGVMIPAPGDTVTVHGTVRWDGGHQDWELSPVDWVSN